MVGVACAACHILRANLSKPALYELSNCQDKMQIASDDATFLAQRSLVQVEWACLSRNNTLLEFKPLPVDAAFQQFLPAYIRKLSSYDPSKHSNESIKILDQIISGFRLADSAHVTCWMANREFYVVMSELLSYRFNLKAPINRIGQRPRVQTHSIVSGLVRWELTNKSFKFSLCLVLNTGWSISLGASPMQRAEASPVTALGSTQTLS
jgi:hypothetical protein